ncbi:MAG: metallophosphatase, partial [Candidatus Paceibacter sp.]|nr:metallophosphatase [Candidatus Paceibacter sp.]
IVMTHHPFHMPLKHQTVSKEYVYTNFRLARKAKLAVHTLAQVGVDMYLSGHYHQSSVGHTAERYKIENYSAISVRAGTVSIRQRGEQQSFNLIFIESPVIRIDTYLFNIETKKFELVKSKIFNKTGKQWVEDTKLA